MELCVRTPRAIRKPDNRAQAASLRHPLQSAREQIAEQVAGMNRAAFRDRVAVELHISVPAGRGRPWLAAMAKGYTDLLVDSALPNDARIDHLIVLTAEADDGQATARFRILPLGVFASEYDRAFRLAPERLTALKAARQDAWGLARFDETHKEMCAYHESVVDLAAILDDEEQDQLDEDPDCFVDLDVPSGYEEFRDGEVRASVQREFGAACASDRGRWWSDNGFDARDRPGRAPQWLDEATTTRAADLLALDEAPGCVRMPPPPTRRRAPGEPSWRFETARAWVRARSGHRWSAMRFGGSLALDIALLGTAGAHMDVDNVAHHVLAGFARATERNEPQLSGYRVYRQDSDESLVRARAMPAVRLELLVEAMRDARSHIRESRTERAKVAAAVGG